MSNIEKIRQEIERLKKILEESTYYLDNSQQALGYSFALDDFSAFIDSLPDETCKDSLQVKEICKENPDSFTGDLNNELENYYGRVPNDDDKINAARHFAEWGASQIPMPEDTVIFTKGVKEGRRLEKDDLALTWEDVNLIDSILIDMQDEGVERYGGLRQYYEETLRRFNEQRKK